ncbi:MAG: hypothetical protein ACI9PY_003685, partial [Ascidiaceihabitans sp.]
LGLTAQRTRCGHLPFKMMCRHQGLLREAQKNGLLS